MDTSSVAAPGRRTTLIGGELVMGTVCVSRFTLSSWCSS